MHRPTLLLLILLVAAVAAAQDPPPPTPTLAPVLAPSDTPLPPTPTPTPTPLPDVRAQLPDADTVGAVLLAARNDLEVLANNTVGAATRPPGWNGNYDITSSEMAFDARLDLEILADNVAGGRPDGWFGVQPTSAYGIARDIRYDLELLADSTVAPGVRPPNWLGDNPTMRCNRSTQALVMLLETRGLYRPTASPSSPTYCTDLMLEISTFTEANLLEAFPVTVEATDTAPDPSAPVEVNGANVAGYFDRGATQLAGFIPDGTLVRPVARSYAQFSRMTLVRGDGFELYLDYQNTTMDLAQFESLGDVNVVSVNTACAVEWCGAVND